ncbi:hypothetical protein OGAPHI_002026 [Ogataea philodendri]|uniref:SET domain-containing protein n=1 Tax=Ogataea philodendri TaxID=1378263 RepID=A0A9P8PAG1_9ASCO|nr:uncharacterized protein OGAPHI_002026 [Ogataea philodendri]KAH3668272.1 hypothetical protein OGAPHI_002026 [Ogataea philodendri]
MTSTSDPEQAIFWLHEPQNNCFWNGALDVVSTQNGAGVVSKRSIEKGTVLLKVPKESILSARTTFIANLLIDAEIYGMHALVIALIYEKNALAESPWYHYINSINFADKTIPPCLWHPTHKRLLDNTEADLMGVLDDSELLDHFQMAQDFARQYASMLPEPPELSNISHFATIVLGVASRAFEIDDFHLSALVPGADLFNHEPHGDESAHFESLAGVCPDCGKIECVHGVYSDADESDQVCEIVAHSAVPANTEIFNTYGPLSNSELLARYAFCVDNNHFDTVCLGRQISALRKKAGPQIARRIKWWSLTAPKPWLLDCFVKADGKPSKELCAVAKLFTAPGKTVQRSHLTKLTPSSRKLIQHWCRQRRLPEIAISLDDPQREAQIKCIRQSENAILDRCIALMDRP